MEDLFATFGRFIKRNEKSAESVFTVHKDGVPHESIICRGIIQEYPRHIPLHIKGEYDEAGDFSVQEICAEGFSMDTICAFLCNPEFSDIGPVIAKRIIDVTGTDLFCCLRDKENLYEVADKVKGIAPNILMNYLFALKGITIKEQLYKFMTELEEPCSVAQAAYRAYKNAAFDVIDSNPYSLMYCGATFATCERLAFKKGFEHCDSKRMAALVGKAIDDDIDNGNTRITFESLCAAIRRIESETGIFTSHPLMIGEEACKERYVLEETDDEVYIYRKDVYDAENEIASNIKRLTASAVESAAIPVPVSEIEKECGVEYSKEQKEAFGLLSRTGIKLITGGPGTGKTTLLNGILKKYEMENPGKEIALCAPTGCAAKRMSECTGRKASTVHRLLGIRPYEDLTKHIPEKKSYDCIVVDEASMLDTFMSARLLASTKSGALVIFLGDKDQLPSVGAGNIFSDLLESRKIETYVLSSVFRQDKRSSIIENSRRVMNGSAKLTTSPNFVVRRFNDETQMTEEAKRLIGRIGKERIKDTRLFTPSKRSKFLSGTINMNHELKAIINPVQKEGSCVYGNEVFSVGDRIMFNKNNYDKGYFNGQEGIIKDIQMRSTGHVISVESDGERYSLSSAEMGDIDLSYAITAHKAQGGECDNAIILIPQNPRSLLKKQLLYVEITRAKKNVIILCEGNALEYAVSSRGVIRRETGLKQMLAALAA